MFWALAAFHESEFHSVTTCCVYLLPFKFLLLVICCEKSGATNSCSPSPCHSWFYIIAPYRSAVACCSGCLEALSTSELSLSSCSALFSPTMGIGYVRRGCASVLLIASKCFLLDLLLHSQTNLLFVFFEHCGPLSWCLQRNNHNNTETSFVSSNRCFGGHHCLNTVSESTFKKCKNTKYKLFKVQTVDYSEFTYTEFLLSFYLK